MDVAYIVYSLTVGIVNFISENDDKHTITKQISGIVQQIQTNITPLFSDPRALTTNSNPLKKSLHALQEVLNDTLFHLRMRRESRSCRLLGFFNPWSATQQLRDDNQRLINQYILLMGAVQFMDRYGRFNIITSPPPPCSPYSPTTFKLPKQRPSLFPTLPFMEHRWVNAEVKYFWQRWVGNESIPARSTYFCLYLSSYLRKRLSYIECNRLLHRLDNNNTGYISFCTFHDFIRNRKMADVIRSYSADPALPQLIWIDDDVVHNGHKVLQAVKYGAHYVDKYNLAGSLMIHYQVYKDYGKW